MNEVFTLKLIDVEESYNYLTSSITVKLITEENNEETLSWIHFITDGDYFSFFYNKPPGNTCYATLYQAFPNREAPLSAISENPLKKNPYSTGELEWGVQNEGIGVTLSSTKRQLASEALKIDVGIGQEAPFFHTAELVIAAEGFSIVNENTSSDDKFVKEYTNFYCEDYSFKRGVAESNGYLTHFESEFGYQEALDFVYKGNGECTGKIEFELNSGNGVLSYGEVINDREIVLVYYATDGEYIAYSVESEDAAKRALYGEFGYFWRVTVPEFFRGD